MSVVYIVSILYAPELHRKRRLTSNQVNKTNNYNIIRIYPEFRNYWLINSFVLPCESGNLEAILQENESADVMPSQSELVIIFLKRHE